LTTGAAAITEPLPLSQRAAFLEALAAELERYPAEARFHGLLHRGSGASCSAPSSRTVR